MWCVSTYFAVSDENIIEKDTIDVENVLNKFFIKTLVWIFFTAEEENIDRNDT